MAANPKPIRKSAQLDFGGVLDESSRPSKVGAHGMTSCTNAIYRRYGSWGKRSGSGQAYLGTSTGGTPGSFTSGIRWYRAFPSPLTQLVVESNGELFTAGDPGSGLVGIKALASVYGQPMRFCSARDPLADGGLNGGGDVLIMTGATIAAGTYGRGQVVVGGTIHAGDQATISLGIAGSLSYTSAPYTVLATDTLLTIAQNLSEMINTAFPPGVNFSPSIFSGNDVVIYAAVAGAAGNNLEMFGTVTGSGATLTLTPSTIGTGGFTGGGSGPSVGPLKYDGANVLPLSPYITNAFTGCVTWHDHVWYWGDPNNPDTLFASDIDQPEGWTFMTQYGGYDIGVGDGDPKIRAVVPIGNILYVFKGSTIYAITGYDFQSGEYQFQVQPAIQGRGTPTQECVATLRNSLIFWDGSQFERLAVGAFDTENIGATIPITSGKVSQGNATLIRAVAGDFLVQTLLNNVYASSGSVAHTLFSNVALFAVDVGSGIADTVLVYDDDASQLALQYAWSRWLGWNVAFWIPFGKGPSPSGSVASEPPQLFWLVPPSGAPLVNQYGSNPTQDGSLGITWFVETGWHNFDDVSLQRELHRIFANVEANAGAVISCNIITVPYNDGSYAGGGVLQDPGRGVTFPATTLPAGFTVSEHEQVLLVDLQVASASGPAGALESNAFMFQFSEPGTLTAAFELNGAVLDYYEEAWLP